MTNVVLVKVPGRPGTTVVSLNTVCGNTRCTPLTLARSGPEKQPSGSENRASWVGKSGELGRRRRGSTAPAPCRQPTSTHRTPKIPPLLRHQSWGSDYTLAQIRFGAEKQFFREIQAIDKTVCMYEQTYITHIIKPQELK